MTWTITALSNSTVSEGGSVSYRLSRTHTGVETVYLSTWQNWNGSGVYNGKDTSGGATNAAGPDYTPFDTTNGIAFSASQSIYDFTISTLDNNSVTESTETFGIVARTQANWAANAPTFLASNTFTILDNDPVNTAPSVSISAGSSYAAGTVLTGDLLFTASDAQGVGDIDYIKVFDANETSGAEWRYAGALIHPGGGSAGYAFEYANRASLTYKVGAGANDFQIQAFDNAGLPSNAPVVQITGTVTVTNTAPSVLIIAGSSYAAGTVLTGDLLFTASDAQGVGDIDYIKVFDANETSGAEWRYAGALIHPGGGSAGYAFEYANRASLTYKVGAGANDFQVQAFDNATLPSNAPVVQITGTGSQALSVTGPTTFSLAANQTISGAQFFQQNGIIWGGSVATIRLHDTIVGQGFFKLGGVSKAGVQTFDVAVQNLSQLTYETGAVGGSNQFSIEVLDSAGNASNALLTTATVTFSSATKSGGAIIQEALLHLGQEYFWGVSPGQSAYSNPNYAGPWDCSEFVSWLVNKVYGEQIGLRTWNAYTGYWVEDAAAGAKLHYISMDDARNTPGAIIFRFDDQQHHIAISEGNGKLIEANVNYHDGYYWSDDGTPHAPLSDGSAPTGVDIGDVKERSFDAGTYSAAMGWKAVEINDVQYTTATVVVTPATETDDYSDASRSTTGRLIVGGAATPGKIETAGDKDWFKIDNLVAGTSYKIVVTGTGTNALGNSFFSVRDDAGNWVTGDASRQGGQSYDDAFGNTNAAVEFTAATSGAYYVVVGGGGVNFASQKGDYQVSGQAISEPANSSAGSATAITLNGAPIQAYVGFGGDTADYYSFTATQTGKITVNLTGLGADIDAVVLNGAGQQIDTLVSSTANAEQRTAAVTAGVTYKIQVAPHSPGPSSQQSSYAIDVGFTTGTTTSTGSGAGLKKADDLFRDNGGKLVTLAEFALASYDVQSWEPLGAFTNDTKVGAHEAFGTLTGLGWQPLQALGTLASPNPSRPVDFQDGFQNGFFASGNSAVLIARAGDALVISFRGTNDNDLSMLTAQLSLTKDEISWYNMSKYYTLLKPLIDQVDAYVANAANGISKIYAIGHSLGAAMVDEFMTTHPRNTAPGSVSYEAVIFAHPDFNDAGASLEIAAANALIAVATTPSFLTLAEGVLDVWLTARAGVPDFHPASDSRITSFHNDTDIINIADFDGKGLIPADENTLVDGILNPGTSHSMLLYLRAMQFLLKEGIPENDVIGLINGTNVDYDRLVYNATKIADGNGNPIDFVIGDGPDTLAGSTSNDILIGGKGDDTYTFSSLLPWGNDTVVDSDGADVIDIGNTNGNLSVSSDGRDLVLKFTPSVLSPGLLSGGTVRISGYFDPDGKHAIETLRWNGVNNQLSEIVTNGNKHFDPLVDSVVATVNATVAGAKATLNAAEWAGSSIYANIKTGTSKFYDTAKNWFVANVSILDATLGDEDSVIGKTVTLSGISNIIGTQYNDKLVGDDGENDLNGAAGNDLIQGGAGNDNIDGGAGTDTVLFSGGFANYRVTYFSDARTFTIEDLRAGQLDGTDTVTGIENFQFADDIITNATLQPDFAEYVSVANATVAAGGSATIDAYAMNVGKSEVGASTAQIYLSTDAIITTSDTLLTTVNSGALKAVGQTGYYDRQTLSVTLATDLAPGTYYIGGIADYDNRVSEGNETNNTYNVAKITVTGRPRPDLTEYVAISNTTVAAGGGATIEAYAMNVGDGVSGASTAKIYLSTDATITTSDIELATVNSGALTSVGQTGYYDHQTLSVSFAANLAPGTYYVGGIADYNNQVSESNEANNTYNVTKITVAGPAQPDLSEYVSVSNTTVAAGGSTTIDAYAMNIGSGASGASTAKIYLSTDATITSSDAVLGTVNSGALTSVGQTGYYDRQTLSVSFAANLAPGTYYIGGIADDGNQVSESNEANNTYNVTKITVTGPAQPDLAE